MLHIYENAPVAGWLGYIQGDGWVLFFAGNGDSHLETI
jgi:hypothetical protein